MRQKEKMQIKGNDLTYKKMPAKKKGQKKSCGKKKK